MTPPSIAVVEAVAECEGVEPRDLDCVLAEAIDPTALDELFESPFTDGDDSAAFVRFDYCGYVVTVRSNRTVEVEPPE
jgi:hypothetical protein